MLAFFSNHRSEVSRVPAGNDQAIEGTLPNVLYDLFGTVNHFGNLESGHYVANVSIRDRWFLCNDSFVAPTAKHDEEGAVLKSEGAYLLFYVRRESLP